MSQNVSSWGLPDSRVFNPDTLISRVLNPDTRRGLSEDALHDVISVT